MSTTRVWNITNNPSTDVPPQNLMVFGRLLRPGQFVQVDEKQLEGAHKVMESVAGKLLVISKSAPEYLARLAERAKLPAGTATGHGPPAAPAKAVVKVEAKPVIEAKPKVEEKKDYKHKR